MPTSDNGHWNRTPKQLADKLREKLKNSEEAIVLTLHRIGQEAVNWARDNGTYMDHTGNLRNSIGYAIYKDRRLIDWVHDDGGHSQAHSNAITARTLFEQAVPDNGYACVVFAGMEYGIYVEAKGYTVLSGSVQASPVMKLLDQALKKAVK
ncbi:MAG TPA: hypothetical protein PLP59_09915 [Thermotogota bacterium]|nr:hypothetical protein [Thermotogota bacterium]HQN22510.1 hypothetical protein [Thermotogota bacterium]HQQ66343.1 hypothetical protein [Thermotogota bacterium]